MAQLFLTLLLIYSACRTSWAEVWKNMRPGYGNFPHSSVGDPIMRLHKASFTVTNGFCYPPPEGLLEDFYCFIFLDASASFFEPGFSWSVIGPSRMKNFSTLVASDVIHISYGYLILLFSVAFVVPSFLALCKNELVSDPVGLGISIRVIIRLIV